MIRVATIFILLFLLQLSNCKEKYNPEVKSINQSYLVVDGNLNPTDTTFIRLSKTIPVDTTIKLNPEQGASVTVEGKDNSIYPLSELISGTYILPVSGLSIGKDYRLHIITSTGKQYVSDFITIKDTPPIDSITWARNNFGVTINMNAHDDQNKSIYYRWEYEETYEIHSFYNSQFKYENGFISRRTPDEYIRICYKSFSTSNIVLSSTAKLQSDIISQVPIIFIPDNSERLSVRYSVLVRQYVVSKQAYDYLQILKKNTESIGDIFGVLPTEEHGNIHCVSNPGEEVIGFLTGSPVQKKRLFISNDELPGWFFRQGCSEVWVVDNFDSLKIFLESGYLIVDDQPNPQGHKGYNLSDAICVDCRTRGGILTKPSFW
jgi:hypothetical protein